ncbi:LysR substrate-binding domain-containing protein [Vibrio penaeicida]|uniref:LysR family transcriptional regulator n=1 Tax=Vibrio penaeicida TaxID=104609 RepID=UPI00273545BB|nr:LysR family transcriptional regulator [Vibrio penaeicida]MDP2574771.1 LysR substrate-binding domain-containing protein [Vibrio penaeicida]
MEIVKSSIVSHLSTFEVAARVGSFTGASRILHKTTGAISQQISLLEKQLGFPLFERHSRGVQLNENGRILFESTQQGLTVIHNAIEGIRSAANTDQEIRLKLTPSFAYKWLIPRLQNFYSLYPDIQIQSYAEAAIVDAYSGDFDLAIDYGVVPYRDSRASLLFKESLLPVMSPSVMAQYDWENDPNVWEKVLLLHDGMAWRHASKDVEWQMWMKLNNIFPSELKGHFFNRADMAMAAAEAGVGVAMGRLSLLEEDIKTQRLCSPFSATPVEAGYFFIQHQKSENIDKFVYWLRQEVGNE